MSQPSVARELDIRLERNSPVPLYYQLARSIEQAITSGELAPGDRLENELSLTTRLGLSRPTARQAIQELVNKGLLVRKRGVGTQVVRSQFSRDERLTSLNSDLVQAGKVPSTQLLSYSVGPLDPDVASALDASDITEQEFIKVRRLRLADDVPLAILTNYLPASFELTREILEQRSLYATLQSLGVNLKIAHQRISARLMTDEEAELLDEDAPCACLTVDRITYDDTGRFVEFGRHVYRAAQYSIQSNLMV
ncbi:GntR family transcriptional regulator [Microlunatus phosphovorus NM-1]|uniref:GntR family transcriptional regulator n=1 Tax=Microlunatus phosphovorus (strain ATCC 700054 / DSM 10555 / JCM 9379 / NBRC 101784 / NCIMB 13414 / VKM Ac-1990 / NM-1) TaxID=1032480 RepID=F5XLI8_MICPN|nr:GntR family transcriptional regulator [Microlunatus phosphovorus]BAK36254.1 GntR family transcriptional regulator [Microlunatus phosphovorus NM-1]